MLPHPEPPSTRRHVPPRRSRWTTWIVLLGTLAVGATLLLTMRALFEVGSDMSRSVREAAPPSAARARGERAGRIETAESEPRAERVAVAEERIHGRVVFPAGTPEDENAWVELDVPAAPGAQALHERAQVRPDGAFAFELAELPRGAVVRLDAPHLYLDEPLVLEPGEERRPIELRPLIGACIAGRAVLAPEYERLRMWIAKSVVELRGPTQTSWDQPLRTVRFDHELRFELRGIPPAAAVGALDARVSARLEGSGEATLPNALRVAARTPFLGDALLTVDEVRPGTTRHVELVATFGRVLAGRVEDEAGRSVAGARLAYQRFGENGWNLGRGVDETDEQGRFELIGLGAFVTKLAVRREGYLDLEQEFRALARDERREGLVLVLATTHSIAGRVLWPDGTPAAGAMVSADPEEGVTKELITAITDDEGAFALDDLVGRRFLVTARASIPSDVDDAGNVNEGRRGVAFASSVAADEHELELRLDAGLVLRGRVVDEDGASVPAFFVRATPVRGGEVVALPARAVQGRFQADDGRFELAGLHPGMWEVQAQYGRYCSSRERVDVGSAGATLDLLLETKPRVSGVVLRADGTPARGIVLDCRAFEPTLEAVDDSSTAQAETDAEGRFEIAALDAGVYVLVGNRWNDAHVVPVRIDLAPRGRVERVELRLVAISVLDGLAVDEGGAPLDHVLVELDPEWRGLSKWKSRTVTRGGGRFHITNIRPMRYSLRAFSPGRVSAALPVEFPADDGREVRLVLPRGSELRVLLRNAEIERDSASATLVDRDGKVVAPSQGEPWMAREHELFGGFAAPGTYRLTIRAQDGRETTRELVVPSLEPVTIELGFDR